MLSRGTCIVALHLLCITNVVRPLVLFSANVDDIKKIARKFFSDPLADHLVDFIAEATSGAQNGKLSAENDENVDEIDQASYEKSVKRSKKKKSKYIGTTKDLLGDLASLTEKISFRKEPDESDWFESVMKAVTSDVKKKRISEVLNEEQQEFKSTKMHKRKETPVDQDTEKAKENYKLDSAEFFEDEVLNYPMHGQNQEYVNEKLVATSGPVNLPRIQESEW